MYEVITMKKKKLVIPDSLPFIDNEAIDNETCQICNKKLVISDEPVDITYFEAIHNATGLLVKGWYHVGKLKDEHKSLRDQLNSFRPFMGVDIHVVLCSACGYSHIPVSELLGIKVIQSC
jgi:C4-type Zn-finger protein